MSESGAVVTNQPRGNAKQTIELFYVLSVNYDERWCCIWESIVNSLDNFLLSEIVMGSEMKLRGKETQICTVLYIP